MFWSNCLICALTQFIKNPLAIRIHMKGHVSYIWMLQKWPHFYWYDKRDGKYYHFSARYEDEPFFYQLWFQGEIKEFHYHRKGGIRFAP